MMEQGAMPMTTGAPFPFGERKKGTPAYLGPPRIRAIPRDQSPSPASRYRNSHLVNQPGRNKAVKPPVARARALIRGAQKNRNSDEHATYNGAHLLCGSSCVAGRTGDCSIRICPQSPHFRDDAAIVARGRDRHLPQPRGKYLFRTFFWRAVWVPPRDAGGKSWQPRVRLSS